jgi:hypothetical protein
MGGCFAFHVPTVMTTRATAPLPKTQQSRSLAYGGPRVNITNQRVTHLKANGQIQLAQGEEGEITPLRRPLPIGTETNF